jgi:quercetin dioxygenase-like cupin family protein
MESIATGFVTFPLRNGLLHVDNDGNFETLLFGFATANTVDLPAGHTHFGVVVSGEVEVLYPGRRRLLEAGDFFSIKGSARINSTTGTGLVTSAYGYLGLNVFGGEIEERGRLRYIDGCTDTLLVPPVRKGDPCRNHLHFPKQITQTPHTHPSVRTGIVYRGEGECVLPGAHAPVPLSPGNAFVIRTNTVHSFNTTRSEMDIIAFHPDSDTGVTDDDHPMVNRTIVNGISARSIPDIRTLAKP